MASTVCSTNGVSDITQPIPLPLPLPPPPPPPHFTAPNGKANTDDPDDVIIIEHNISGNPEPAPKRLKPNGAQESEAQANVPRQATPKKSEFRFGPYVPIIKTEDKIMVEPTGIVEDYHRLEQAPINKRLVGEILPDDSIVDSPSLLIPLLLKKKTNWPAKDNVMNTSQESDDSDIQVVKVIRRDIPDEIISELNPRYRMPENYIKDTVIASLTNHSKTNMNKQTSKNETVLAIDDYSNSSVGQMLSTLGLSLATEFNLEERSKKLNHKMRKGGQELEHEFKSTRASLIKIKSSNAPFKLIQSYKCHLCKFKTEFESVLEDHLNSPHVSLTKWILCNWCSFKSKDSSQILSHNHIAHGKSRMHYTKPLSIHCCRFCPFETDSKRKYTAHMVKCEQSFRESTNLTLEELDTFHCITSKPVTQQDIRIYESTLKALRLAAYNPHQIKVSSPARGINGLPIMLIPKSSPAASVLKSLPRPKPNISVSEASNPYNDPDAIIGRGSVDMQKQSSASSDPPMSSNLLRLLATNSAVNNLSSTRMPILHSPKTQSPFANGMSVVRNTHNVIMAPTPPSKSSQKVRPIQNNLTVSFGSTSPNQQSRGSNNSISSDRNGSNSNNVNDGTFIICEICDAYIGGINFLKSHMEWAHKVKIHSKVLETLKPPVSCAKCNWRFFTDQGLERHLLGAHGLVTSNLQESADKEKDSGRCTICGVRCISKLISHMKDVHKVHLRPAQVSYKCKICSATFSLYRHFENHIYRVHRQERTNEPAAS